MSCSVLHVITSTQRRGAEVFAEALHQELTGLGWRSDILALQRAERGLNVRAIGSSGFKAAVRVRSHARQFDVVVAHGSSTLPVCALASLASTPFVYRNIGDPSYWLSSVPRRVRAAAALRQAAHVVALSPEFAASVNSIGRYPAERVCTIPNAVPAAHFNVPSQSERDAARLAFGIRSGRVLAFIGSLSEEKRPLAAVRVARATGSALLMAGCGPLERQTREEASTGGVELHQLGAVDDVAPVLAAADALVLPSATEGMPAAIIEAGLRAVPAIASDVGSVGLVIEDGVTGVLVPPDDHDALVAGVEHALAARDRLGMAARQRCAEFFSMEVVAPKWASLLSQVVRDA